MSDTESESGSSDSNWKSGDDDEEDEKSEEEDHEDEEAIYETFDMGFDQNMDHDLEYVDHEDEGKARFERKDKNIMLAMDRPRPMPPVSVDHLRLVDRLREDRYITTDKVYELMKTIDLNLFYKLDHDKAEKWAQTNATMLENTNTVVKPGDDVLSFPLNMYFNVCLCFLVGERGSVLCFGHSANWNWLEKAGLGWLDFDDRIKLSNDEALYPLQPYARFILEGFPIRQPYDVLILAESSEKFVPPEVKLQLKPGAICYQPSSNLFISVSDGDSEDKKSVHTEEPMTLQT